MIQRFRWYKRLTPFNRLLYLLQTFNKLQTLIEKAYNFNAPKTLCTLDFSYTHFTIINITQFSLNNKVAYKPQSDLILDRLIAVNTKSTPSPVIVLQSLYACFLWIEFEILRHFATILTRIHNMSLNYLFHTNIEHLPFTYYIVNVGTQLKCQIFQGIFSQFCQTVYCIQMDEDKVVLSASPDSSSSSTPLSSSSSPTPSFSSSHNGIVSNGSVPLAHRRSTKAGAGAKMGYFACTSYD